MASNHELVRVFPLPSTSSNQDAVDTRMIKTPGSVITDDTDYMRSRFIFWFALTYNLTHHSFNSGSHGDIRIPSYNFKVKNRDTKCNKT